MAVAILLISTESDATFMILHPVIEKNPWKPGKGESTFHRHHQGSDHIVARLMGE